MVSALHGRLSSLSANVRCCVVSALKQMVVEKDHPVDEQLRRQLLDFLRLMGDADRHVRKAAVTSLTAAAHGKPALVAPHLAALLPLLCEQTKVRPDALHCWLPFWLSFFLTVFLAVVVIVVGVCFAPLML